MARANYRLRAYTPWGAFVDEPAVDADKGIAILFRRGYIKVEVRRIGSTRVERIVEPSKEDAHV